MLNLNFALARELESKYHKRLYYISAHCYVTVRGNNIMFCVGIISVICFFSSGQAFSCIWGNGVKVGDWELYNP